MERRWSVRDFQWDEGNEEHIGRHGVSPPEVEELFLGRMAVLRGRSGRYVVLGRSGAGRLLMAVVEKLGGGWVRVVTARDMSASERSLYSRKGR